jgi:hypothetical protein
LDAPWDEVRVAINNVSASPRGVSTRKVDAAMKKGRKVGRGNTARHYTPLDAPWDDVRAALNTVSPRKGDFEAKKKGRTVGRGKASLVGTTKFPFNSK